MSRRSSLQVRLTAWYAAGFLVLGAVLLVVSYAVVRHNFTSRHRLHVQLSQELPASVAGGAPRERIVRVAPGLPPDTAPVLRQLTASERAQYRRTRAAFLAAARQANERALHRVLVEFLVAFALVGVAAVVGGWFAARRALAPIARITETARRVSDRTLHERIALDGPRDELHELASAFNTMLARLDEAFDSQRRFVANASHELRTPLTIVRTELDVTLGDPQASVEDLRAMADVVRDATARSERLIEALLALARSEGELELADRVDLAAIARAAVARHEGDRAFALDLQAARVDGDAVLLERLVENLVENAVRYGDPSARIAVHTGVDGGFATLVVASAGDVLPAEVVPGLFEPFRRLEPSRSRATGGYGLGLAVVRAVAEAHGGSAMAVARPEGGLSVRVAIPVGAQRRRLARPALSGSPTHGETLGTRA